MSVPGDHFIYHRLQVISLGTRWALGLSNLLWWNPFHICCPQLTLLPPVLWWSQIEVSLWRRLPGVCLDYFVGPGLCPGDVL